METKSNYSFTYRYTLLEDAYLTASEASTAASLQACRSEFYSASLKARQGCLHHGTRADIAKSFEQHLLKHLKHPERIEALTLKGEVRSADERAARLQERIDELARQIARAEKLVAEIPSMKERLQKLADSAAKASTPTTPTKRALATRIDPCSRSFQERVDPKAPKMYDADTVTPDQLSK